MLITHPLVPSLHKALDDDDDDIDNDDENDNLKGWQMFPNQMK